MVQVERRETPYGRLDCTITLPKSSPKSPSTTTAASCFSLRRAILFDESTPENIASTNEAACFIPNWPHIYILQWAREYQKDGGGENKLVMDLAVAQYQRRALGILTHMVFGAYADKSVMNIYASWWCDGAIIIRQYLMLDLMQPRLAVQFYLFLRMVLSQTRSNQSEFASLIEDKVRAAQSAYEGTWKAPQESESIPETRETDDLDDSSSDAPSSSGEYEDSDNAQEDSDDENMKSTTGGLIQDKGECKRGTESLKQEDMIVDSSGRRSMSPTAAELDRVKRQRLDCWTGTPPTVAEWIQSSTCKLGLPALLTSTQR
ncbi:hypothetical protein BOTBODRAFT_186512 [Botryobasidium botryosum FD-172 SS1]|uniref:Uncharacterized protein n=1 Tax=Botryobasidium botryosum (strain FD-172 SS1) TaxID=930990 RepID=A0A067MX66_BOTB1|nr:hypothetical protein BOTBODRAFT_186512 [Botryobasidium botryosum FD-172 SS1]